MLAGFRVEIHYVSRPTIRASTTVLAIQFISLADTSPLVASFVETGLLLGVYGFTQYGH